ncbi:hypothetical protein AB1Y20_009236 [Prymnesium parvum]|uniref:Proteasome adapter and scaffold protein ECM29 HEAT-repeat domain-containing protein n=1 Tax=Prymnesium parvum TaxID=97485 RepID=A0AB34K551_PRYPA
MCSEGGGLVASPPPHAPPQALQPPPLPARGLAEVLRYLFELLEREAEHLEARRAGLAATGGSEAAGALAAHLQRCLAPAAAGGEEVAALLELLYASLQAEGGAEELLAEASERLLRLLEAAPAALAPRLQECLGWMQQLALSKAAVDEATQSRLCAMMALTCRSMPAAKVEESLGSLVPLVPPASTPCVGLAEQRKAVGAMVAVGLIGSYQLEAKASGETLALLTRATLAMAALLTHDQAAVAAAAAASIGALGSLAPLPLPDGEAESGGAAEAASSDGVAAAAATPPSGGDEKARPPQTKLAVAARLLSLLDKLKTKEKAVLALGQLGHGEPHGIFRNDILSGLFGLAATKDVDLHLTVGESLAKIGTARPSPDAAASASRLPPLPPITIPRKPLAATAASGASAAAVAAAAAQQPNAEEAEAIAVDASLVAEASGGAPLLGYVLQKVLRQYIVDYKPLLRQAAVAWLLSIMKVAAQAPEMLKAAPDVQDALLKLLADSNEVTQELASKGLSILYDACDAETQERIVAQLVKGLQASRAASASSSGGDMATFSELSEIANNAGQPELVYKLMELSTASAVWNTRKGVAFALAEQSRGRLQKHLDKLVPTLYRYTFDPNPKIAAAMKQVWEALVPEPKKALAAHFNAVLSHVREGLTDRLWRSREASCSALAELLSGRTYDEVGEVMGEIQQKLMRALDDIKESVRKAALAAWRALTSAAVRLVDQTNSHREHARELLDALLPTLLDQGISHAQDEVRRLCTRQLLKICEAAGSAMQPHVVRLVPVLLESLSVVEDPMLNYLQLNAGQAGISDQALETARVNAMRSSDVSAVLDQCLRMMGEREVSDALPAICALLSRGTGLPTRSGTARFVLQLAQLQPLSVEPHSAQLLRVLRISTLSERSDVARKAYASAAAQVARNAPVDTLGELVIHLVGRYTSDEAGIDDDERMAITTLMRELLRSASDAMARVKSDWLPLAFIARHEPRSQLEVEAAPTNAQKEEKGALSLVWGQAFDEAGIGPSAVGLYVGEILQLIGTLIEGTSWALRRAAAYALVELTSSAKTAIAAKPELGAEVERLAGLLCDKKWRDKEDLVSKVAALLPVPPPRADAEQPEDASSADM